ncbi:hypothetical protein ACSBR1_036215 [Camellia fascicularis]
MAGYMTLLEAWIYEHFWPFKPHQNMEYTVPLPHVHRWTLHREVGSTISHLQALWEKFDRLAFDEIYQLILVLLSVLITLEPHHSERVLRQFGRVQTIPPSPLNSVRVVRGVIVGRYRVMYHYLDQIWESSDNHVLSARRRSTLVRCPVDCVDGYMKWYTSITHLYIQNPTHRFGFDPRAQDSRSDVQDAEE